jgi:hypothetical protein
MWKSQSPIIRVKSYWEIGIKWCLSFFKPEWTLDDYPIELREQDNSDFLGPERLRPIRYWAKVLRWGGMQGFGNTTREASDQLREVFSRFQSSGKPLPRPGTFKKIELEFASDVEISQFTSLQDKFVNDVLGIEWALMTDESSLWHFHAEENNDAYYAKIRELYGVDVSDVEGANIAKILAKIASSTSE